MADSSWLDDVRKRLLRQGLPPSYVQRFVEELTDHLQDLKEKDMEDDAISRLGEPEQVADTAVAAYRRRSFLGRHPTAAFLVFAISPIILWIFVWVMFASVALNLNTGGIGRETWLYIEHRWLCSLICAVSSVIAGTFYGELAMWLCIGRKWTLASYAAIGAIAMYLEFGLGMVATVMLPMQFAVMLPMQFAIPFAVGWWFIRRKHERKYGTTKVLVFALSPVLALTVLSSVVTLALRPAREWIEHEQMKQWTMPSDTPMRLSPAASAAAFHSINLLRHVIPTALVSLLYCILAKRVGLGRKWTFISCTMIVTFETMGLLHYAMYRCWQHSGFSIPSTTCDILAEVVVPLAIGWWFLRRKQDQAQLQLAS